MIVESYDDVILLSGALRSNFWDTLHTAISLTLKRHPSGVIVDCSGLTEATAGGAETFHDIIDFTRQQDARVILAAVPENVLSVLRSVPEVRSQLAIADSVEDARRSLDLLAAPMQSRRKQQPPSSRILLWLSGESVDKEALTLASQLAQARDAELHFVYVVVVPRNLPLTAPLPREEGAAAGAIRAAQEAHDRIPIPFIPHIERGRDIPSTIEGLVQELKAPLVILPISREGKDAESRVNLVRAVLANIDQEIILVRGARPQTLG